MRVVMPLTCVLILSMVSLLRNNSCSTTWSDLFSSNGDSTSGGGRVVSSDVVRYRKKPAAAQGQKVEAPEPYRPATTESYILDHMVELGFDRGGKKPKDRKDVRWDVEQQAEACAIWKDPSLSTPQIYDALTQFRAELKEYSRFLNEFQLPQGIKDVRKIMLEDPDLDVCALLELGGAGMGLAGIFNQSQQLSWTDRAGYAEPLLPPMRHPEFCFEGGKRLFDLDYMVLDFPAMCRKLKPTSRTILIDMGASLQFHANEKRNPASFLSSVFTQFGIPFDHIYAFEIAKIEPADVYDKVPDHMFPAYHWINLGVSADPDSRLNPLRQLLLQDDARITEDDLVIVKLDIDTSSIEVPMARQMLNDAKLCSTIDHLFFEHHVMLKELAPAWKNSMEGSARQSMQLFSDFRKRGIVSHFWV
jgi:hypothetical protein